MYLSHRVEETFGVCWEALGCGGKTPLEGTQGVVIEENSTVMDPWCSATKSYL